jgi:hypothetical protein
MKPPVDPPRMLDELEGSADLHKALSRLQGNVPSAASMAAIAASFAVPAPAALPVVAPKSGLSILKLVGGVGLLIGAAVGGAKLLPDAPEQLPKTEAIASPSPSPALPANTAVAPPAGEPGRAAATRRGSEPVIEGPAASDHDSAKPEALPTSPGGEAPSKGAAQHDAVSGTVGERAATPAKAGTTPAQAPPTSYESLHGTTVRQGETELLRDARSALAGSPAVALALTEKHRQEYVRPVFAQERELIAITALARLGRAGDAQQRAERFRRDYPKSAYRRQIDQLVP